MLWNLWTPPQKKKKTQREMRARWGERNVFIVCVCIVIYCVTYNNERKMNRKRIDRDATCIVASIIQGKEGK